MSNKAFSAEETGQVQTIASNITYAIREKLVPALTTTERYDHNRSVLAGKPIFNISRSSMMPTDNSPTFHYASILCNKQYLNIIEALRTCEDLNELKVTFTNQYKKTFTSALEALLSFCVQMREALLSVSTEFRQGGMGGQSSTIPYEIISHIVSELEKLRLMVEKRNNYFFFSVNKDDPQQTGTDFMEYLKQSYELYSKENPGAPIASYHKRLQQELRDLGLERILFDEPFRFSSKYLEPFLRAHADKSDPGSTYIPGEKASNIEVIEKNIDKFNDQKSKTFLMHLTELGIIDERSRFFSAKPDMSTDSVKYAQALLDSSSIWQAFRRLLAGNMLDNSAQENIEKAKLTINELVFPLTFATRSLGLSIRLDHSLTLYDRTIETIIPKEGFDTQPLLNQLFGDAHPRAKKAFDYLIEAALIVKHRNIDEITIKAGRIPFIEGLSNLTDSQNTATLLYENCKYIYEAMYYDFINITERLRKSSLLVLEDGAEKYRLNELPSISLRDYHLGLSHNLFKVLDFVEYLRLTCLVKRVTPSLSRPRTGYIARQYREPFSFFIEGQNKETFYQPAREYA